MAITAPYNFVPLSDQVFFPDNKWVESISHDIPFEDGVSGTLSLKITAHTPLLIGNNQTKNAEGSTVVTPFQLPSEDGKNVGKYAIPGSSLKGMIRNVLEIASFGKMQGVDNKRYAVRDLTKGAKFYRDLANKSTSGWLKYSNGKWEITSCDFVSVKQSDLFDYFNSNNGSLKTQLNSKEKSSEKYELWKNTHSDTKIAFDIKKGNNKSYATNLGNGNMSGHIVFTGQVDNKKIEFIFYNKKESITVPQNKIIDFLFVHRDAENSNHWDYLEQFKLSGLPVFYIQTNGLLHSIGLSKMYKVAYKNSIHEAITNTTKYHLDETRRDLAEVIFGYTDDDNIEKGLKGRVNFSLAVCEQNQPETITKETILNGPKPTYYPNYIKQEEEDGKLTGKYKTLMNPDAELRGWKRYPVRPEIQVCVPTPDDDQGAKVRSIITALSPQPELTFTGKVRFHNLKIVELGALVWTIKWGGDSKLRHAIGMGKSFGYGQISLEIKEESSQILPNNKKINLTLDSCIDSYQELMKEKIDQWETSEQLFQLKEMANPDTAPGDIDILEHMKLDDYLANKNKLNVLPPYAYQAPPMTPERWLELNINFMVSQQKIETPSKLYFQKGLFTKWLAIPDTDLKEGVKECIKNQWNKIRENDVFWDDPIGKAVIKVRKGYGNYLPKESSSITESKQITTTLAKTEQERKKQLEDGQAQYQQEKPDLWIIQGSFEQLCDFIFELFIEKRELEEKLEELLEAETEIEQKRKLDFFTILLKDKLKVSCKLKIKGE